MKKNIYTLIGLVIVMIIVAAVAFSLAQKPSDVPQDKLVTGSDTETFSGTITAVDTGCFYDAICSVSVDGKKVILVTGRMVSTTTPPMGRLIGAESVGDLQQKIGWHANVYATTTPNGDYTIYGNSDYYVEVLDIKK
jgi:hypothetical protein